MGEKGIGAPIIARFLSNIYDMNESTITHQLANLKASGDYARRLNYRFLFELDR